MLLNTVWAKVYNKLQVQRNGRTKVHPAGSAPGSASSLVTQGAGEGAAEPNAHNDSLFWTGALEVGSEVNAKP